MARVLKPGGIAGFSEPGRLHSQTPMSQKEMADYEVLENDLILEDVVELAYRVGFTASTCKLSCGGELTLDEYKALIARSPSRALKRRILSEATNTMTSKSVFFLHKGSRKLDSRSVEGLSCDITIDSQQLSVNAGDEFSIRCFIRNTGQARWLHSNPRTEGIVRVGTHLCDENGKLVTIDFSRSALEQDIEPGETTICNVTLRIAAPGRYRVMIDMVSEYVCWFEQLGFKPLAVEVLIT